MTRPSRRLSVQLAGIAMSLALLVMLVFAGGFIWFAAHVPRQEGPMPAKADGIVALTGGPERLSEALELLAAGRARRLLISGVNPETSKAEIARLNPQTRRWLDCCVDLDRRALNTAGNAVETRNWVRTNKFRRVIVVTSNWHMPRSLVELGRELPEVELVPYPVVTREIPPSWWRDEASLHLLATEYVKYLAALVKIRLAPRIAADQPPAGTARTPASSEAH